MSAEEQEAAGCVIGRDYPAPIVDHAHERQRAMARYRGPRAAESPCAPDRHRVRSYVMTNTATEAFIAGAADYDAPRRRLVPCFDASYGAAPAAAGPAPGRVLDLGAGTGLLGRVLLAAHPRARFVLVDGAAPMLERAASRSAPPWRPSTCRTSTAALPSGRSAPSSAALAVHHLDDAAKADLCARAFDVAAARRRLGQRRAGRRGDDPADDAALRAATAESRALGASDAEWAAAEARMAHDRCSPVAPQLAWLRDAGYEDVACTFRSGRFAVMTGRRPR